MIGSQNKVMISFAAYVCERDFFSYALNRNANVENLLACAP